jgi:hypothetical protein
MLQTERKKINQSSHLGGEHTYITPPLQYDRGEMIFTSYFPFYVPIGYLYRHFCKNQQINFAFL